MFRSKLSTLTQKYGQKISRRLFTEKTLMHPLGKILYLFLYRAFKFVFESTDLKALDQYIKPHSTVVDIGANVGVTTTHFHALVGSAGKVVAFEPDPMMVELFRYATKQDQKEGIHLFPIALGERDGTGYLFQNLSNRADNRMVLDSGIMTHAKKITVPIKSFSSIAKEHPSLFADVSFIKIDVQGYEYHVLSGMTEWIRGLERKPVIHLEFWPYGLERAGTSAHALLELCASFGYPVPMAELEEKAERMRRNQEYIDITLIPSV